MHVTAATPPVSVTLLEREWRALGFVDGAPPQCSAALVQADCRIYRSMRCGVCAHRGHSVKAMNRQGEYRLLCKCRNPRCGNEVEA